jgi:RNA polymerase sigma-70 factor (ECF subfamily)
MCAIVMSRFRSGPRLHGLEAISKIFLRPISRFQRISCLIWVKTVPTDKPNGLSNLVSRIRGGDQQADAELVERYNRVVMSIIRRGVGDAALADDLYQETFCIVLEKIRGGDVREPDKLSGFVCGVAKTRVNKHFQRVARQAILTETSETAAVLHATSGQLDELLRKEEAGIVRQILGEMTNERDAQVLFRFYLEEDDKERICADLGLTKLQFNLVLHRARERYRELYERTMRDKHN